MLIFDNLTYRYTRHGAAAIDSVAGCVEPGIHLLMGKNGAGKTTLLRTIAGLIRPAEGECLLDGTDTTQRLPSVRSRIFFLPDNIAPHYDSIRRVASAHSPLYERFSPALFEDNLSAFGLTGHESLSDLSLGMSHKAWLAYVLALRTELLLLDEPANGLDISSRKTLRAMLARCVEDGQTVIISTHSVADLKALYDGVMMLHHGRLVICHPTWEIGSRLTFTSTPVPPADAIFTEQESGLFKSIIPAANGCDGGDVDFALLYSAMLSAHHDEIINMLHS